MVVTGRGHGAAEPILVFVYALDKGGQEDQKLRVLPGRAPGLKEVFAGVGVERPIVMLAGAIDPAKGFFVEEADQPVLFGCLFS